MTISIYSDKKDNTITHIEKDETLWMSVKATEEQVLDLIKQIATEKGLKYINL